MAVVRIKLVAKQNEATIDNVKRKRVIALVSFLSIKYLNNYKKKNFT